MKTQIQQAESDLYEYLNNSKKLDVGLDLVTGFFAERKKKINTIQKNIQNSIKYNFQCAESSIMPTIFTDPHHLPLHPYYGLVFLKTL